MLACELWATIAIVVVTAVIAAIVVLGLVAALIGGDGGDW